ncbi:MAG: diguanylate cyclase [Tepidisphaeraceae bacterium]
MASRLYQFRRWLAGVVFPCPDENLFRMLTENSSDVICRMGPDLKIKYASPSATRVLGYTPEAMIGKGPDSFVPHDEVAQIEAERARETETGHAGTSTTHFRRGDGRLIWLEVTGHPIRDPHGNITSDSVLVMRDITDRKALEQQLSTLALTDGLTGLYNRRAFDDLFEREWRRSLRNGDALSLLLLDIDRFKPFNDTYGHQVGDDCLRAVAGTVKKQLRRPGDAAARYGGEEMAVILAETDAMGAIAVAEQIRLAVEALRLPHVGNADAGGVVTVSIGVATAVAAAGGSTKMPDGLLSTADHALYKAKHAGRNRCDGSLLLTGPKAA